MHAYNRIRLPTEQSSATEPGRSTARSALCTLQSLHRAVQVSFRNLTRRAQVLSKKPATATMAIAKSLFRKPVDDAEVPKHKGLALLGFGRHHHKSDVTVENTPSSRRVTRKHKRSYPGRQQPQLECGCSCNSNEQPHKQAKSSVYDRCLSDAMTLKARLHRDNSKPSTRFRLAVMKRVIVPPVSIPKSIAEHRGSKDFVGGHRVPFTRCMWETEKMRQQLVLRRLYMLPILREDTSLEA
ncbi:hypothetical protein PC115_g9335 [Phytophthora cactorum]|uniref:Uncharacterized protein n=2 Tax=Phytophthora cactorum TaxID=29920 RepID=A0A8T1CL73_9STRA|nr:hypothetical protein PC115_g9335 [Phytophthora cactorum]KAG3060523.1 hypothetical protein PC121_g13433 [Phytophthora cactorum]